MQSLCTSLNTSSSLSLLPSILSHLDDLSSVTMQLTYTLAAILATCSAASAYVVEAYPDRECQGTPQTVSLYRKVFWLICAYSVNQVNVWNNSQATWMKNFRSVKVVDYGGSRQRHISGQKASAL